MSDTPGDAPKLWCPCCGKIRVHRSVAGVRHGVHPLREVFEGLEVEQGPDDPLVLARTRRCECSAEWVSAEVPSYFLYQLLEERRLYHEARRVAEAVIERARAVERSARTLSPAQTKDSRSLRVSIHEAETLIKGLNARSDNYFLR
ncbi:MAG: hypothetical protein P4L84_21170 [Isosphaeraceae bacterium]|nr:hypothetical protein [Isosphaeraceae bacterium]